MPPDRTAGQNFRERATDWLVRLRRRLPYLVWYDDEIDVRLTFPLEAVEKVDIVETVVDRGAFGDIRLTFADMGITFMQSFGSHGRHWDWDESLEGPISIRFRGRASKPELRREWRPRLVSTKS